MSLNLPIEDIKASGEWIPNYGHGLGEKVRAKRNKDEYKGNFDLELEGAANICSVLSETKGILDWDFIDVYFTNKYEIKASDSKKVSGVVRVTILRETLRKLQENKASTLNYPTYWHLVHGYKDQPDSNALLQL